MEESGIQLICPLKKLTAGILIQLKPQIKLMLYQWLTTWLLHLTAKLHLKLILVPIIGTQIELSASTHMTFILIASMMKMVHLPILQKPQWLMQKMRVYLTKQNNMPKTPLISSPMVVWRSSRPLKVLSTVLQYAIKQLSTSLNQFHWESQKKIALKLP